MSINETTDFRKKYQSFLKWKKYMSEKMLKVDIEKFRDKWVPKFIKDVCEPLDNAWQTLTNAEREAFSPEDTSIEGVIEKRTRAAENVDSGNSPF